MLSNVERQVFFSSVFFLFIALGLGGGGGVKVINIKNYVY